MGVSKVLMLSIVFAMVIAGIRSEDKATDVHVDDVVGAGSDSALKLEIEQLKSKISSLESSTLEKTRELKSKDEKIEHLEREIQEKSASVTSLQSEVELLQKKGAVDAEELAGKAYARSNELENEVEKFKNELEEQKNQRNALEARTMEAEKKVQELNLKLKSVHGAWLPPWLSYQIVRYQEIVAVRWSEHGEPIFNVLVQKISERSGQAQKWVEPHLETAKTRWIPIMKTKCISFSSNIRPHMEKLSTKTVEVIEVCRSTATPHIVKLKEFSDPHIKKLRKSIKPYIEQVSTVTKPHVEKARSFLKPYSRRVIYGYGKFLETAGTYHHQIQESVRQNLKKYELTKHLATKELIWFVASCSLALPIFLVYRMLSSTFGKKGRKSVRGGRSHNNHRRHKRRHADQ